MRKLRIEEMLSSPTSPSLSLDNLGLLMGQAKIKVFKGNPAKLKTKP